MQVAHTSPEAAWKQTRTPVTNQPTIIPVPCLDLNLNHRDGRIGHDWPRSDSLKRPVPSVPLMVVP
jgi:hypothetical protein